MPYIDYYNSLSHDEQAAFLSWYWYHHFFYLGSFSLLYPQIQENLLAEYFG